MGISYGISIAVAIRIFIAPTKRFLSPSLSTQLIVCLISLDPSLISQLIAADWAQEPRPYDLGRLRDLL